MMDDRELAELFERLRECSPQAASAPVEARLKRAVRLRQYRRSAWCVAAVFVAASVSWVFAARSITPLLPKPAFAENEFVALPYGQSDVPLENAIIVRMDVQGSSGAASVDVLVGQDGVARAVRFNR